MSAACAAAARGDVARLAALLRADPALLDVVDEHGYTPAARAAADGHAPALALLLRSGARTDAQDHRYGNTALHEAAWKGYSQCVSLLAAAATGATGAAGAAGAGAAGAGAGALDRRNASGATALHLAAQAGHNQSTRELLLAGADADVKNNYGDTPLHTAARYGHAGVSRILLSAQCRAETNRNGDSALHIAAAMGRRKLTRILLEAGCDKSLRNQQGETARDIATRKGLDEIIAILNTPVAKQRPKTKDATDGKKKKGKKNVTFEAPKWSPYGCHTAPDPRAFPPPRLGSLPAEPLGRGEQYYLDLAGNIRKGPVGAGYTCYCAPFFKHMDEKIDEGRRESKRHVRNHERIDQKVNELELKTQGQISELTRFVAAERAMCKERHRHLEQWLTRGLCRASERVKRLDFSPKGSLDIAPMKRSKSLDLLDAQAEEWNQVNKIIQSFNKNADRFESNDLRDSKRASRSADLLESKPPTSPRREYKLKNSRSSDQLDNSSRTGNSSQSPERAGGPGTHSVTAEIHVKSNRVTVSQSPVSASGRQSRQAHAASPGGSYHKSDSDGSRNRSPQDPHAWKSQVLQRTADDIRKKVLEKEMAEAMTRSKSLDISQDGYVRLLKQGQYKEGVANEPRKSVQELVARAEMQQMCQSPELRPISPKPNRPLSTPEFNTSTPDFLPTSPPPGILKTPQQPQRPAPVLKEKPKTKRFSLHNLIPFPTRKTFQPKQDIGNNSESSDDEDQPIRSANLPGPMNNSNLLQTLPLPNYESVPPQDYHPPVPKDAYFHDIQPRPYSVNGLPPPGLPPAGQPRDRTPVFAGLADHSPVFGTAHRYSEQPGPGAEAGLAGEPQLCAPLCGYAGGSWRPLTDPGLLQSRLASLAVDTHLPAGREHNDSGYSTKVYGSSQGPSPSLSGHGDYPGLRAHGDYPGNRVQGDYPGNRVQADYPGHRAHVPNGKGHVSASSLV